MQMYGEEIPRKKNGWNAKIFHTLYHYRWQLQLLVVHGRNYPTVVQDN